MDFIKENDRCITNAVSSSLTEKNVISEGRSHMLMTCWCAASVHAIVLFACTVVLMHVVDRGRSLLRANLFSQIIKAGK